VGCVLAVVGCGRRGVPYAGPAMSYGKTVAPYGRTVVPYGRTVGPYVGTVGHSAAMTAVVVRVVDGDTLVLRIAGRPLRVRLIGVDAPETWLRHDCFGAAATRGLRRLTPPGARLRAAGDVRETDRYGRRLLYLWTPQGVFVNAALVRAGFARALTIPPDTSRATTLADAEAAARRARAGLWRPALAGCGLARRSSAPPSDASPASPP
jgi:micrococcal nuclease